MRKFTFFATLVAVMISFNGWGQTSIVSTGVGYSQDFNTMTSSGTWTNNSTISGWYVATDATSNITTFAINTGSTTTAGLYSFGIAGTNPYADRAIGFAPSNSFTGASGTGKGYIGWRLVNNTGSSIGSLTVTWTGEQWRKENNAAVHSLQLSYQVGTSITSVTSGTWTSASSAFLSPVVGATTATALDGNAPANRVSGISIVIDVLISNGDEIMLRWEDLNDSGNDHFLAIDDISVTASAPATSTLFASPSNLTGFQYISGSGPSSSQTFSLSASSLTPATGNITVSAPTNYEVSLNNLNFQSTQTVSYSGSSITGTTVYTRLKAGLNPGLYNSETITISGGGATSETVTCSGTVTAVSITAYRSKTNGNWNDATTWQAYDGSTWFDAYDWPTDATKDVTIRTGHTVVNPAGYYNAKANNLNIETGAKLWANSTSGASFVYVYGDFTNNGTVGGTDDVIGFDIEGASCTLSGSGTFTASRINKYTTASTTTNLFINQDVTLHYAHASYSALYNNGSGDMLNIIVGAGKYLNVPNATVNLNDATLTLENGAMFLENGVLPNNSLTNFSLKRDISGNVYHLLASPVETTTIGSVFPSAQHNNIWIRSYTETTGNWTNLDAAGSFVNGYGYSITMDVASTTATFTGILKLSDATPVLTNSGTSTNAEYDGWNLIGNPFAAPLDWNHGSWAKTNIDNTVYTWSAGIGNYVSWNGTAGGLTNGIIPVAQGFFVKANAASPSINIPPTARVLNTQAYYKNTVSELLSLKVSGTANAYSDETFINYNTQASPLFDNAFDAFHLDGLEDAPQLWTLADQKYAINVMKSVAESPEVNMAFKAGVNDEFTITASGMESFNGNEPIWLNDFATGTRQDLRQNASYTFTAKPGDDENRFKITFAGVGVDNPEQAAIRMYTQPGTIFINLPALTKAQMNIYNLNGQIVYRQAVHASGLMSVPHKLTTGTYIIQLVSEQQTVNQKLFIQ